MPMILNALPPPATSPQASAKRTTSPATSNYRAPSRPTVEYVGVFRREVFSNADGFKIIKLEDGTTVKLNDPFNSLTAGLTYRFSGYWQDNQRYGGQDLNAQHFTIDQPTNERGIIGFLSKMCVGVGPWVARQIYNTFGADSIEVVRSSPEKVSAAGILEHQKALAASECLQSKDNMERTKIELNEIFQGHGFTGTAISTCIKLWGCNAPAVIRRDPFKLMVAGVRGAGFTRCDKLYHSLQLPPSRIKRQMLAIWYKLKTNRDGHTWVSASSLGVMPDRAIKLGLRSKWIEVRDDSAGGRWYADGDKAKDERELAKHIKRLMGWKSSLGEISNSLWPDVSAIEGLSDHQRTMLTAALTSPIAYLGGYPGTGKTYSVAKLVKKILDTNGADSIGACAPTGMASRRVQNNLFINGVHLEAKTVHSMFGISVESDDGDDDDESAGPSKKRKPLDIPRFVIIDESPMLNTSVACRVFAKLPTGTHVLLVGDINQLLPIGHGAPIRDIIRSKVVPSGELTEIRRNSGLIVTACHQIAASKPFDVAAKYNPENGDNLRAIYSIDDADTVAGVAKIHALLPGYQLDPVRDCQTIVALNSKGACSKDAINKVLQDSLNPSGLKIEGKKFRTGDKVVYLENTTKDGVKYSASNGTPTETESYTPYGTEFKVDNGDVGTVVMIDAKATIVKFTGPERLVKVPNYDECNLDLAYALTCHKMQGSESPVVVVVLDPAAASICSREFVYTAISRAKKFCILVGPQGLVERFCAKVSLNRRKTFLAQLLKDGGK